MKKSIQKIMLLLTLVSQLHSTMISQGVLRNGAPPKHGFLTGGSGVDIASLEARNDLYMTNDNTFSFGGGYTLWTNKKNCWLDAEGTLRYGFGAQNGLLSPPNTIRGVNEVKNVTSFNSGVQLNQTQFGGEVGPALTYRLAQNGLFPHINFALLAGYQSISRDAIQIDQDMEVPIPNAGRNITGILPLMSSPELRMSGLTVTPRVKFGIELSPLVTLNLEGRYTMMPSSQEVWTTRFVPAGTSQDGFYTTKQLDAGKSVMETKSVSYSTMGASLGLTVRIGKPIRGLFPVKADGKGNDVSIIDPLTTCQCCEESMDIRLLESHEKECCRPKGTNQSNDTSKNSTLRKGWDGSIKGGLKKIEFENGIQSSSSTRTTSTADTCCQSSSIGAMTYKNTTTIPTPITLTASSTALGSPIPVDNYTFNISYNCNPISVCTGVGMSQIKYVLYDGSLATISTITVNSGVNATINFPVNAAQLQVYMICGGYVCDSQMYQFSMSSCCPGTWGIKKWGYSNVAPSPSTTLTTGTTIPIPAGNYLHFNVNYTCPTGCSSSIQYNFFNSAGAPIGGSITYPSGPTPILGILVPIGAASIKIYGMCGGQKCDSIINKISPSNCCVGSTWGTNAIQCASPRAPFIVGWNNVTTQCSTGLWNFARGTNVIFRFGNTCPTGCSCRNQFDFITGSGVIFYTVTVPCGTPISRIMPMATNCNYRLRVTQYCNGVPCKTCTHRFCIVP